MIFFSILWTILMNVFFVWSGEASAGKSSLINLLLCEQILPTAITASTSRVCRIKYCERCVVSTKDCMEKELENMSFKNIEEMTDKLKSLAETDIAEICYVDIYIPVPFLQVYAFKKRKSLTFFLIIPYLKTIYISILYYYLFMFFAKLFWRYLTRSSLKTFLPIDESAALGFMPISVTLNSFFTISVTCVARS